MIKKILIATDGSETAEKAGAFAIDMASQMNCDVYCVYVADALEFLAGMDLADMYIPMKETILERLRTEGNEAIQRIKDMADGKGVNFDGIVVEGENPVKEIFNAANTQNADIIVVGSHGKTGIMDYAMGSITTKLLGSKSPCPILVVQAD